MKTKLLIPSDRPPFVPTTTEGRCLGSKMRSVNAGSCTAPTRLEGVVRSTTLHHHRHPHRCLRHRQTKPYPREAPPPRNTFLPSWLGCGRPPQAIPPLPDWGSLRRRRGMATLLVMEAWDFLAPKPKRVRRRCQHWDHQHHRLRRGWAGLGNMCWAAGGWRVREAWGLRSICSGSEICPACWCTSSGGRRCMKRTR